MASKKKIREKASAEGIKSPAEETKLRAADEQKKETSPPEDYFADEVLQQKRQDLLSDDKTKEKEPEGVPPDQKGEKAPKPPRPHRATGRPRGRPGKQPSINEQISEETVKGWSLMTANFTIVLAAACGWIWPRMPLNENEQQAHTRAWAVYLTLNPPEDLSEVAKLNLAIVYIGILTPRVGSSVKSMMEKKKKGLLAHPEVEKNGKDAKPGDTGAPEPGDGQGSKNPGARAKA